jgi:hypothetical protein
MVSAKGKSGWPSNRRRVPRDLAERFFELQQLRKKVQKLEKLRGNEGEPRADRIDANAEQHDEIGEP